MTGSSNVSLGWSEDLFTTRDRVAASVVAINRCLDRVRWVADAPGMAASPERSRVERCALCGAPLSDVTACVVNCGYCHEENRLVSIEALNGFAAEQGITRG